MLVAQATWRRRSVVSRFQSQLSYVLLFGTEAHESSTKELLVKPVEPGPEDCCQNGCQNCVWEVYRRDLAVYNQQLAVQEGRPPPPVVLDPFAELERKIQMEKEAREQTRDRGAG
ncbi:hypothetical protein COCSUDRAFT_52618 [Coccomyxa subellipsoidea C-169]|uniref:Oxidoreductase-like domain-containing protein n=1 Tax=Coccomyxa subellipsoidea (strain C-169) TaxID=574566 RepID=I0Z5J9_COCSC|nr:hypothetical protein COCSUDRAFT_52618 [Coccomyxa subellipsoidea C-169]EIE25918.1 hypothetical protein COCSUDRAFT_52618 [Coccomyxa subellipsoidea C-169]|eukprot:XP_005650462.1 hypothetical protein COCSUDRAFT_52618 [Coccomyxa subellipsoidea C-169]